MKARKNSTIPELQKTQKQLNQQLKDEIRLVKNETFTNFLRELIDDKDAEYSLCNVTKSL